MLDLLGSRSRGNGDIVAGLMGGMDGRWITEGFDENDGG